MDHVRSRVRSALLAALFLCFTRPAAIAQTGQTSPPALDAYFTQAAQLEKQQDFAGAEKLYRAAARDYPNQPEILKRLGVVCQTELKFQDSIDLFNTVLQG